ncbi:hypothetical protein ACA910_011235 [Epithemia clementina (nom. ined.)]
MILRSVDHEHGIQGQQHPEDDNNDKNNNNNDNEEEEDLIGDEVQDTLRQQEVPHDEYGDNEENYEDYSSEEENESAQTSEDFLMWLESHEEDFHMDLHDFTTADRLLLPYICDECGSSLLPGTSTLYHSTRIVNYDLCQECFEENHKHLTMANAFLRIGGTEEQEEQQHQQQLSWNNNNIYDHDRAHFGLDYNLMRVTSKEWKGLELLLANKDGKLQSLDVDLQCSSHIIHPLAEEADLESRLTNPIATYSTLKAVYVTLPLHTILQQQQVEMHKVHALLQGIAQSKSILTLSVTLDFLWESAVNDLCDLIRHNKSVRSLFIRYKPSELSDEEQERNWEMDVVVWRDFDLDREVQVRTVAATKIFEALAECSMIQSFFCGGINDLGEDCLQAAIRAMKTRPSLKRIKADFADTCCTTPLQDLINAKKHHWMKGWNDPEATIKSRWDILTELLSCQQVDEQDQVAALFYFVRSNPAALPVLVQQEPHDARHHSHYEVEDHHGKL